MLFYNSANKKFEVAESPPTDKNTLYIKFLRGYFFKPSRTPSARTLYTTMNTHLWIGRIIASILSLLQATTLRDRYYTALQRIELLETAIDDIGRINSQSSQNPLIQGIVDRLRK